MSAQTWVLTATNFFWFLLFQVVAALEGGEGGLGAGFCLNWWGAPGKGGGGSKVEVRPWLGALHAGGMTFTRGIHVQR